MSEYETNTANINNDGLFSVCDGIWDEKTRKFRQNTLSEQIQCCLDQCMPIKQYCKQKCKKDFKQLFSDRIDSGELSEAQAKTNCDLRCDIAHAVCSDKCRLISHIFQINPQIDSNKIGKNKESNVYYTCAINHCPPDLNLLPDSKCINANADKILACCSNNCSPTALKDCSRYCKYSHSFYSDPDKINKEFSTDQKKQY